MGHTQGNCEFERKPLGSEFLKGLHDRHAQHNAHYGLKRGKEGSEAIHRPVKDYYRDLQALAARMERQGKSTRDGPGLITG